MSDALKKLAAEEAVTYLKEGMIVGLGTGSTAEFAIKKIGKKVDDGFDIIGIPTSVCTKKLAERLGIPLSDINDHPNIDITIDGADQVDPKLNLIKGGGGALLREKIVASCSKREIIIIDEKKLVQNFSFPLPVEITPYGWKTTLQKLKKLGCIPTLREKEKRFLTDNNNYIIDCQFKEISENLEKKINSIPGVIENGLFIDLADEVVVGTEEGIKKIKRKK
jgi:ribose 5-phosphate isomerase A